MATRSVPLPRAAGPLVEDICSRPADMGLRLILADCLDDAGDPRVGLVRLLPHLLALPKREQPRGDVPCRVWRAGNYPVGKPPFCTSRGEWASLHTPHRPLGVIGRWGSLTGLHNVGRLLHIALSHVYFDFIYPERSDVDSLWCKTIEPVVWAYACRLLGPHERDKRLPFCPVNLCSGTRAGRFRCYLPWCEHTVNQNRVRNRGVKEGLFAAYPWLEDADNDRLQLQKLTNQGVLWSRWLDVRDALVALCPWQDAWQAYLQSRLPKPAKGSPAWRTRKAWNWQDGSWRKLDHYG